MRRLALTLIGVLCLSIPSKAETLVIVDLGDGVYAVAGINGGDVRAIGVFTEIKTITPDKPLPDAKWDVDSLHVLVIDDENLRGTLPQSQVNIFTSVPLRDWLADNGGKFRFSSNDSLTTGSDARNLELPVWVKGWDLLMNDVQAGKVTLPAWIISNGTTGTIEPLPKSVDDAVKRLEAFK